MFSESQLRIIAIIPMVTAWLSIAGSVTIIFMLLRSEKKLSTSYRRIIFGMSCMDIIYSLALSMTSLASPEGTEGKWNPVGNTVTCTLQGLALFIGVTGTTTYNCMLSIFYTLTIANGVSKATMSKRVEPFFHAIPFLYATSASIFLLNKKSFNSNGSICMISSYPQNCHEDASLDCSRGENADEHYRYFVGYPIVLMFFIIVSSMIYLYSAVVVQERRMSQYRMSQSTLPEGILRMRRNSEANNLSSSSTTPIRQRTTPEGRNRRAAMIQCLCYVTAYLISWTPVTLYLAVDDESEYLIVIGIINVLLTPLQGFSNFLVFIRPQVKSVMDINRDASLWQAFKITITSKDLDISSMRRRQSLMNRQANGGRRFTAREWHLQQAAEQVSQDPELCESDNENDTSSRQKAVTSLTTPIDYGIIHAVQMPGANVTE